MSLTHTKNGAGNGIRTRDLDLGKVALYQLSYSRSILRGATVRCASFKRRQF